MDKGENIANLIDFSSLRITLASPEIIKSWSHGEVTKPETINYRTLKPEKDGLFCERIFGPTKDWECYCGKYKRIRYRGIICDKCGVEVTQSKVRRERMGHITLASPVAHVWFFKGAPSKLSLLLDMTPRALENVIYFASYLILEVDEEEKKKALKRLAEEQEAKKKELVAKFEKARKEIEKNLTEEIKKIKAKIKNKEQQDLTITELTLRAKQQETFVNEELGQEQARMEEIYQALQELVKSLKRLSLLSEDEYLKLKEHNVSGFLKVGMGAEALLEVIEKIDLDRSVANLRAEVQKTSGQRHVKATKRLRVIDGLRKAGLSPSWMILTVLPVLPPDLRPMVQLAGGRFATSDLNDLYRRVINRNNRLKHLIDLGAPEIILRNEKRMLQEAVDSLIDATQRPSARPLVQILRSLSDMLRGKQGRFRQNLLGKRVDYSGRSVIIVGPELSLTSCGLPKEMALEMFKPFVLRELITRGLAPNVKSAKNILERRLPEVFDILEEITRDHPVLLNRAPTLHKLGILAFYPVLIEGGAIRIHPCVCAGYNADFDGDQMAVHVPISSAACQEAKDLMLPTHNLLKPADGSPITLPNKEMALGCYWLTSVEDKNVPEEKIKIFSDETSAILVCQSKRIGLREMVKVRIEGKIIKTSVGRILFNEILPAKLRFVNDYVRAGTLKALVTRALELYSPTEVATLIDALKDLGFWAVTLAGGISVSVMDCEVIPEKPKMIAQAEVKIAEVESNFREGLITNEEKRRLSNEIWLGATEEIADLTWARLDRENPVKVIIESGGARASKDQLKQLTAMRGLVVDPLGKIVELPTKANFREGLSIFEYVTSSRGSRKGLTDSALKTADAGYLTRRLVDVSHDAIIRLEDCGTKEGIEIGRSERRQTPFSSRVLGRVLAQKVIDPKDKKKVLLKEQEELTEENIGILEKYGIEKVVVRSPLTCGAKYGLCNACYGRDFGTRKRVEVGTPVGIIAAQSIGEPGTQLTMRVKHTGGIVGLDVTQGLPRVEELFEARTPKVLSPISEISGKVQVTETADGYKIRVRSRGKPVEEKEYLVPLTSEIRVADGDEVFAGEQLASGFLDIKEVLAVMGLRGAQKYLIEEIQAVYESQGIPINDKHFEVVVKKMSDKVRIDSPGDTALLPGELVDKIRFEGENGKILAEGGEPATAQIVILGITRTALYTESWLSAASFQETTNILTEAAVLGKEDKLIGLKENVIIGRLIPTSPERARLEG
ncbi:MAG: DNA-directed RNA polymerase subunit beta' [Microgenomates group bacterium LiPW_16]|nr:MAG: DNA-directed RNA polymerase subunit beta' [Microgenomates group bacterium LiPW_16]